MARAAAAAPIPWRAARFESRPAQCGTAMACNAEWTVLPLIMARDDALHTGDLSFVEAHYEMLVPLGLAQIIDPQVSQSASTPIRMRARTHGEQQQQRRSTNSSRTHMCDQSALLTRIRDSTMQCIPRHSSVNVSSLAYVS